MQSLIHGNFEGAAQEKASTPSSVRVGRDRRRDRPLLGGFITTYLSWRVAFGLEVVVIADRAVRRSSSSTTCPIPAHAKVDLVGAILSVVGMGGVVLGILVWQEGGEAVGALPAAGAVALARWRTGWSGASARANRRCSTPTCSSPSCSASGSPDRCSSRSRWAE